MGKKALLMILDGWGIGDHGKDDVIFSTPTPYWDYLINTYPNSQLQASGENVGLPNGQMGNSEVGHLNIGAGRIVYQDLVKINKAIADKSIVAIPIRTSVTAQFCSLCCKILSLGCRFSIYCICLCFSEIPGRANTVSVFRIFLCRVIVFLHLPGKNASRWCI